jgi:hypothetical protein
MENNRVHSVSVWFVSYPRKMASNDKRSSWLIWWRDDVSLNNVSLNVPSGIFIPWTMRPLDDASLVRCIPWSTRPLDDASLSYVSLKDVSKPFRPEDWFYTGEVRLACRDVAGHTLHCQASVRLGDHRPPNLIQILMRSRVRTHGSGTRRPRDVSSKRGVDQGTQRPRNGLF